MSSSRLGLEKVVFGNAEAFDGERRDGEAEDARPPLGQAERAVRDEPSHLFGGVAAGGQGEGDEDLVEAGAHFVLKRGEPADGLEEPAHDLLELVLEELVAALGQGEPPPQPQQLHPVRVDVELHVISAREDAG